MINPINETQKKCVIDKTSYFIDEACKIYQRSFEPIVVDFYLKGRVSGMYRRKMDQRVIRYNSYIFAKYFEDSLKTTIPHEVAHYITDMMFNKCCPHGNEWREVMRAFGADASRTCDYNLEGIPVRAHQRHEYHCLCMTHEISSRRHNKIQNNKARYYCKQCKGILVVKAAV